MRIVSPLPDILIGVIINSMEEARAIEHRRERERVIARAAGRDDAEMAMADVRDQADRIRERLLTLRDALEDLGDQLHDGVGRAAATSPSSR